MGSRRAFAMLKAVVAQHVFAGDKQIHLQNRRNTLN
jgi:hypothetical protein